jgi:hypothetical protein
VRLRSTLKPFILLFLAFASFSISCPAVEAVLEADISAVPSKPERKLIPNSPRLRLGEGHITLLKFDTDAVVPKDTTEDEISNAILKIWINQTKDFSPGAIEVFRSNFIWEERPDLPFLQLAPPLLPANRVAFTRVRKANTYVTFDVTKEVKGWFSGQLGRHNSGLLLRSYTPPDPPLVIIEDPILNPEVERLKQLSLVRTKLHAWLDSKESKGNEPTLQIVLKPKAP